MDNGKLLNILYEIESDEENLKLQETFNKLIGFLSQNQIEQAEQLKLEIDQKLSKSTITTLAPSKIKILKELGGEPYFGLMAKDTIDGFFASAGYKLVPTLQTYVKDRADFLKKYVALRTAMNNLSIEPHFYNDPDKYEIGISLSESFEEVSQLNKALKDWDKFLQLISEIETGTRESGKISLVSSGCWEFFVLKSLAIAKIVDKVINKILDLYDRVQKIQLAAENIKHLKFKNKNIEMEIRKEEESVLKDFLQSTTEELIKLCKHDDGRKNELRTELGISLKNIVTLIEQGARIEVNPPEIEAPNLPENEEEATKKEHEKRQKEFETHRKEVDHINLTNQKLSSLKPTAEQIFLNSGLLNVDDSGNETVSPNHNNQNP